MQTILKGFIEFVTTLLLFYVLVFWPRGLQDLSSLTRDRTYTSCIRSLNHWTSGEVPQRPHFCKENQEESFMSESYCLLFLWLVIPHSYSYGDHLSLWQILGRWQAVWAKSIDLQSQSTPSSVQLLYPFHPSQMLHPLSSFNAHSILVRSFNVRLFLESCSVAHSCSALCDPMDFSTPGFLVLYYLLELAQAHAH